MAIFSMSDDDIRSALKELDQATYNHLQWAEAIYSTLICRTAPDPRDLTENAHHMCRFGQWYDKAGIGALEHVIGFAGLGIEHERMHQYATVLFRSLVDGTPISVTDYQRFATALKQLQLQIATVQRELTDALNNLDPMTGIPNRTGMLAQLREQQAVVKRHVRPCAVAMMDLDQFKDVNDKYGHLIGDKVLIAFARYVMEHLRPYDKAFRYGGDEFLLFFPDTELREASEIVERLRKDLSSLGHRAPGEETFHVNVSFGLTLMDPDAAGASVRRPRRQGALCRQGGGPKPHDELGRIDALKFTTSSRRAPMARIRRRRNRNSRSWSAVPRRSSASGRKSAGRIAAPFPRRRGWCRN